MYDIQLGQTHIRVFKTLHRVEITLPDGRKVDAIPHDTEDYIGRALDHGYDNAWDFCRDHEIGHVLVGMLTTGNTSPTLAGVADKQDCTGKFYRHWGFEEAVVLAWQRFARLNGTTLEEIATRGCPPSWKGF